MSLLKRASEERAKPLHDAREDARSGERLKSERPDEATDAVNDAQSDDAQTAPTEARSDGTVHAATLDDAQATPMAAEEAYPEGAAEAEARYKELSDQYVRLVADFDNFRRRTRANEAAVREQAAATLIRDLLPVIDNLRLALAKSEAAPDDAFAAGVTLIEQQLTAVLQSHGVQPIEAVGQPFDPAFMEAVAQIDGQGHVQPGHVAEQLRRGYMLHDKVLRAAQVVVARAE